MRCGRCCTSFGVCVTPSDIRRISKRTKLAPSSFISSIEEPPGREREEPAVLINGVRSLIILKWAKLRKCIFYDEGCKVYESRPMLCRTYPFRLTCRKLAEMKSRACPVRWAPDSTERKKYAADIRRYNRALEGYRKMADEWNENGGGTLKEFLAAVK